MADINFYKYLIAAFRYKRSNNAAPSFEYLGYKLPYETIGDKRGIFYYARNDKSALPRTYTNFPDTKEGNLQMVEKVLNNLDRHLDQQLDKYFNQTTATEESVPINAETKTEQVATPQTTTPTMGTPTSGLPPVPTVSFRPPRINIPQITKEQATGKTEVPQTGQANTGATTLGRFNTQGFKIPNLLKTIGSNVGSKINIGLNKGLNKTISGINNFSLGGGSAGGSRSVFSRLGRFGRGGGTAGGGSLAGKAKGRGGLIFAGSIIAMMLLTGVLTMIGTTPTGEAAPPGTSSLDYTLPLKDASVQPLDIRDQVKAAFSGAKLEYWDKIVQQSQAANFNPALALALWIEETGASQTTLTEQGGGGIPNAKGEFSYGHLGCAPWEKQTIDESLTCLFKFAANYTNDQFAQFMAAYSGGPAANPFSNNPNFPANIKTWYSRLVPSGTGALTAVVVNAGNFNVDISALPSNYQQWAQEVLSASTGVAPKFQDRLNAAGNTKVITTSGGSHTEGTTVFIKTGYNVNFFKQIFIHELGHRIKGVAGTTSPICNGQTIESIESEGYLTYYAEHATPAHISSPACGTQDNPDTRNNQATRSDEDFGESVSYYINKDMNELNYGSGCITYNSSLNPYARGDRPAHKAYIQCLLGP